MAEIKRDDGLFVEYSVPISEKAEVKGDFTIKGIAINETTTANGHKFIGEELRSSANTLVGVPLLKDHINSVDNIVGRVKGASFDETNRNIPFNAVVKDPTMIKMIKDGLITDVSVGAHVDPKNIEENEDGTITPRGIIFKELSLVGIGADDGAKFGIALKNAYDAFKLDSNEKIENTERRSKTMTENESQTESTETNFNDTLMTTLGEMSNTIKALSDKVEALEVKEADADEEPKEEPAVAEEPKEEPKEEAKEEVSEDEEEDSKVEEAYSIKQGVDGRSFTMERRSYVFN